MGLRTATGVAIALAAAACTGAIDDPVDPGEALPPRAVDINGPSVLPHVQAFADAVCGATEACTISTRTGHHPSADRALDILVSDGYGSVPSDDNALGDLVAQYALAHQPAHGVWYVIWRQRYNDGAGWDPMEDRGSITQNHFDHVHISFDATLP